MLEGVCEIWIASIPEFAEHQSALDRILTPDERAYVRTAGGQATARLSRGLLRLVLAGYLGSPPTDIEIDRSCPDCARPHGRPRLSRRPAGTIEFSVSHGGDVLVLAFADNTPVGVDVEPIGAVADVGSEFLDFTLTAAERSRVLEAPAPQRRRTLLRHWTGKEAILKALGTGLEVEPQAVTLPPFPIKEKVCVTLSGSPPVDLWISEVEVGPAHVCTVATGREVREVRPVRLSPSSILGRAGSAPAR